MRLARNNTPGILPPIIKSQQQRVSNTAHKENNVPQNTELTRQVQRVKRKENNIQENSELTSQVQRVKRTLPPRPAAFKRSRRNQPDPFKRVTCSNSNHDRCAQFNPNTRHIPIKEDIALNTIVTQAFNDLEHFCALVIHPVTKEPITSYKRLSKDPLLKLIWQTAFGKEFGNLAQGDNRTGQIGTNSIFVLTHEQIKNIPKDRVVTYARVVVDYRPQKEDPNRVRIRAGGNLIIYPGELTTHTADLTTSKVLWNSTISTRGARYMCIDIHSFFI